MVLRAHVDLCSTQYFEYEMDLCTSYSFGLSKDVVRTAMHQQGRARSHLRGKLPAQAETGLPNYCVRPW